MHKIALVTARAARGTDYDMPALLAAFRNLGAEPFEVDWDDEGIDWTRFDGALLRSPWDYVDRYREFVAWLARVGAATRLLNPPEVIAWTTDKHYLARLAAAGVATVPFRFVEPGADVAAALAAFLADFPDTDELVVKPAVGAGSRDARRHRRDATAAITGHLAGLVDAGRSAVLQPYLARVDSAGETALIHIDGRFSHAVRKGPLLASGAAATEQLYASEEITPRQPDAAELALAARAIAALPFAETPAYARVDLIRDDDDSPRLLELELAEPSLFFDHAPGSAERLAHAVLARCG